MNATIKENELPVKEFEKLGLYHDGRLNLENEDLDALLAGRRTEMHSLTHLELDGFRIHRLDAKLSLSRNPDGTVVLNLHPIYKEVQPHPLLTGEEAEQLISGKIPSIEKVDKETGKKQRQLVIEYDEQTREFVTYHPDQVEAPLKVNGEELTEEQQKAFQEGKLVELSDGTRLQHSATDSKGIRSDMKRLILSVLLDGGVSYLLLRGIKNLKNNLDAQKDDYTKGYNQALADMMLDEKRGEDNEITIGSLTEQNRETQHNRGYGRNFSR